MHRYPELLRANVSEVQHYRRTTADGLGNVAAELWALSHADYFVITDASGLGRVAAFAGALHHDLYIYSMTNYQVGDETFRLVQM